MIDEGKLLRVGLSLGIQGRRVCHLVLQTGSHTAEDMLLLAGHKTQSAGGENIKSD